jgi:hypothetical protein
MVPGAQDAGPENGKSKRPNVKVMNIFFQKQLLCRLLCFFDLIGRGLLSLSHCFHIHRDLEDLAGEPGVAWLP